MDAELKAYTNYFENDSKESLIEIVQGPVGPTPTPLKTELDQDNWRYGLEAKFDTYLYDKHALTLGGSFEYDDAAETAFDLAAIYFGANYTGEISIYPSFDSYRLGFYLQDTFKVSETLELTGGFRIDKHEDYQRDISPRLSLVWLPYDYLDVKLFYGQAYRTPDLYALALDPGVKPEKITSYEGEITLRLHRGLLLKGSYFYNSLEDLLENVTQGQGKQSGREVEEGTEFSIHVKPLENLALYANHTFLFGERQRNDPSILTLRFETDDGLIGYQRTFVFHLAPDHVINLGASYTWRDNYIANVKCIIPMPVILPRTSTGPTVAACPLLDH